MMKVKQDSNNSATASDCRSTQVNLKTQEKSKNEKDNNKGKNKNKKTNSNLDILNSHNINGEKETEKEKDAEAQKSCLSSSNNNTQTTQSVGVKGSITTTMVNVVKGVKLRSKSASNIMRSKSRDDMTSRKNTTTTTTTSSSSSSSMLNDDSGVGDDFPRRRYTMMETCNSDSLNDVLFGSGSSSCSKDEKKSSTRENRLSRGLSRIFRRHQQTYHVSKMARRTMSEINLANTKKSFVNLNLNDENISSVKTDCCKDSDNDSDGKKKKKEENLSKEEEKEEKNSWVQVHKLKSQSDGGVFDPDDKLVDVADDREQIMAIYEEDNDGMPSLQHNAGDGTSASSVGTNSPDIFQGNDHKFQPFARTDIEITGEELSSGPNSGSPQSTSLQVRRGSEPALNRLSPVHLSPPDPSKRWSAAPVFDDEDGDNFSHNKNLNSLSTTQNNNTTTTSTVTTNNYNKPSSQEGGTKIVVSDENVSSSVIQKINNSNSHTLNAITSSNSVIPSSSSTSSTSNSNVNSMAIHSNSFNPVNSNNTYAVNSSSSNSSSTATTNSNQSQNFTSSFSQVNSKINTQVTNTSNKNTVNVNSFPRSASAGNASISYLTNTNSNNINNNNNNNTNSNNNNNNNHLYSHGSSKSNSHISSQQSSGPSRFTRDQNRLSMQFVGDGGARWQDAADRALWLSLRKEPLGANASPETPTDSIPSPPLSYSTPVYKQNITRNDEETFQVFHRDHSNQGHNHLNNVLESTEVDSEVNETNDKDIQNPNQDSTINSNENYRGNVTTATTTNNNNNNNYKSANKMIAEEVTLILQHETGPLGIHVVPEHHPNAKNQGLIVQGVEPGGRIDRDGRILAGDKIIEINGNSLIGVPFQKAQELFREGLNTRELKLKVIKISAVHQQQQQQQHLQFSQQNKNHHHNHGLRDQNQMSAIPIVSTSDQTNTSNNNQTISVQNLVQKFNGSEQTMEEKENMVQSHEKIVGDAKVATVSPTKKLPLQAVPLTRPSSSTTTLINANTRKIGRKYEIDLQKGPQGLGFSITTRDNPAGGNCPIYIKNILPVGAAIEQGQLRPGDRLLEVNGIEITGKSQQEAVSILRNVPQGGIVKLIVSRQERVDLSPKLPRQIPPEKLAANDLQTIEWGEREILNLEIPVLDTEKAGLGISVKGKTSANQRGNMIDMGIYIKSVIHGGAASKFGGLKPNDQLLSINGISLLDRSNTDAMETLRKTMTMDGPRPKPGFITLTIARRVPSSSAPTTDISGSASGSCDEMDSWNNGGLFVNSSISVDGNRSTSINNNNIETNNGTQQMNQNVNILVESNKSENTAIFLPAYNHNPTQNQFQYHQHSQQQPHNLPRSSQTPSSSNNNSNDKELEDNYSRERGKQSSLSPAMDISKITMDLPRNPVLDRLTGKSSSAAVRSESYYKATNETWNATLIHSMMSGNRSSRDAGVKSDQSNRPQSITVQNLKGEMVLIEDDYYSPPLKPPRRSRSSTPEDTLMSNRKPSIPDTPMVASPNSIISDHQQQQTPGAFSDATYASQTSLATSLEDAGGFARDAFGRQSMSEKRHATLDAKNTDTYQRNKKLREERDRARKLAHEEQINNEKRLGEALARERNLQDELARRGTKRPFSENISNLHHHYGEGIHYAGSDIYGRYGQLPSPSQRSISNSQHHHQLQQQSRTPRRGFGDQLIELFNIWGTNKPRFCNLHCACSQATSSGLSPFESRLSTNRSDGGSGLQRVNSADSLVAETRRHPHQHVPKHVTLKEQCGDGSIAGSKRDIGPSLGMKKSSSLESLQTMVQEIQTQEDIKEGQRSVKGPAVVRVVRGRGCNESFRQAVDRSYECPIGELGNQMETLAEEETESCISGATYGQRGGVPYSEPSESDMDGIYGKTKGGKKKQGLFRGLGSMFRFGRHRKSTGSGGLSASEVRRQQLEIERQEGLEEGREKEKARQAAHLEQMRIEEQYRRLVEKQKMENQHSNNNNNANNPNNNYGITVSISSTNSGNYSGGVPVPNYMQNGRVGGNTNSGLRPNHQFRKSMENQAIRERERERADVNGNLQNPNHLRSASYDVYNEMTRPGSRIGHYINYEEIRHHLNDEKANAKLSDEQLRNMRLTVQQQRQKAILESRRHQQHYHSQRRENPRSRSERPVSNFYEYESVQAAMHAQNGPPSTSSHYTQHTHVSPPQQHQQMQQQQQQQQQQSLYGYSNGNNGVTLPSPSTLPISFHQRSTSQFQAQTIPSNTRLQQQPQQQQQQQQQARYSLVNGNISSSATLQHQQSQSKFSQQQIQTQQKPNSLPRRSQKDLLIHQQQQQQQQVQQVQQSRLQQQQQLSGHGHYISQNAMISPTQNQGFRHVINNPQQLNQNSNVGSRIHPITSTSQHVHNHPNGIYRTHANTTLGSKV